MPAFDPDRFRTESLASGYTEVLERRWQPHQVVVEHSHPFDAHAIVTQGEMWLTVGERVDHLRPGDGFDLANGTPHSERYGPDGATYWVARR